MPFSQHSTNPPNLSVIQFLEHFLLRSPNAASSRTISPSIPRISSLSLFNVSVWVPKLLCSELILFNFFSADSAEEPKRLLRRRRSSRPSSRVRIAFMLSRMVWCRDAQVETAPEKCESNAVDAVRMSWTEVSFPRASLVVGALRDHPPLLDPKFEVPRTPW